MTSSASTVSEPVATVRGTVEALFFSSPKFSAGRLRTGEGEAVSFAGALMVRAHDAVVLHDRSTRASMRLLPRDTLSVHPRTSIQVVATRTLFRVAIDVRQACSQMRQCSTPLMEEYARWCAWLARCFDVDAAPPGSPH